VGNQLGIQLIRFGHLPNGSCEAPDMNRVGNHKRQLCLPARHNESVLKSPSGLDNDAIRTVPLEYYNGLFDSLLIIADREENAQRPDVNIQMCFACIDPYIDFVLIIIYICHKLTPPC